MSIITEIRTESGSKYLIRQGVEHMEVRRSSGLGVMRRDRDWVRIHHYEKPEIGKSMVFLLEGLGELPFTERITTPVVSIKETEA